MSAFRVGQKVVCVDASRGFQSGLPVPFGLNDILVIRQIARSGGLRFEGIPTIDPQDGRPALYHPARFRPLITKTQAQDVQMILSLFEPARADA